MKKILITVFSLIALLSFYNQESFADDAENEQWLIFISPMNDYSFEHPQDWIIGSLSKFYITLNSPENEKIKQNIPDDKMRGSGYIADVTIGYYSSLKEGFGVESLEYYVSKNSYLSETKKILFVGTEAWEMLMGGSSTGYVIMVENKGHLYQIGFNNCSSKKKLTDIHKKIIESFKFIE